MVWMESTSVTVSALVSPTHIVICCTGPEVGFTANTRPERNDLVVLITSTSVASRVPSPWKNPRTPMNDGVARLLMLHPLLN